MTSLWPEVFVENTKPSAKTILEQQGSQLSRLTQGMVYGEVEQLSRAEIMDLDMGIGFAYNFNICGRYLDNYRFRLMTLSHDIALYPVSFRLDGELLKELGYGHQDIHTVNTPEELEIFLKCVFNSERVKNVVGAIMSMSK